MQRSLLLENKEHNINDRKLKIMAQKEFCKKRKLPNFASDGRCYGCGRNVFDGYSYEECANDLITGCRFCHTSLCE